MGALKTVEDIKKYIKQNGKIFFSNAVAIEDLNKEDEWLQEDIWDEIYEKEVIKNGKL